MLVGRLAAARNSLARIDAHVAKLRAEMIERRGGESGKRNRRGDFFQSRVAGRHDASRGNRRCAWTAPGPRAAFLQSAGCRRWLLSKKETQRDRAGQLAVDIHGRSAHALHDAGIGQRSAFESAEDDGFARTDIFEHAENFDFKFFDLGAGKNGSPDAVLAGTNILQRKNRGCSIQRSGHGEQTNRAHVLIVVSRVEGRAGGCSKKGTDRSVHCRYSDYG